MRGKIFIEMNLNGISSCDFYWDQLEMTGLNSSLSVEQTHGFLGCNIFEHEVPRLIPHSTQNLLRQFYFKCVVMPIMCNHIKN